MRYEKPVEGGRKRDDGQEVKWKVTFPQLGEGEDKFQRGELPFFCHDITPRCLRVPISKENTTHPSGAYGINSIRVFVPENRVPVLVEAYKAILDTLPGTSIYEPYSYFYIDRMNKPVGQLGGIKVHVQPPTEEWISEGVEERGGVLLGDLVVGAVSEPGQDQTVRIDVPLGDSLQVEGVGTFFLDFAMRRG